MVINPISNNTDTFSCNLQKGIIHLVGEINDEMAASIVAQLMERDAVSANTHNAAADFSADLSDRIRLYINSPGGSVSAGLAIYDTMRILSTPVDTVCVGVAASMAAVILAGGRRRYILPHAEVMIHQPSGGMSGKASDILVAADHIRERKQVLNQLLAEQTGKSLDQVSADTELDFWMNAEAARNYGIVDEIIPAR
jgi:ATP-dependent Clp protease protease subunit